MRILRFIHHSISTNSLQILHIHRHVRSINSCYSHHFLHSGVAFATSEEAQVDSRIVQTKNGKIVGRRLVDWPGREVDAYQGIPFAKPPVGPLRFQKPQPVENWDGIRETKAFGNRCIQPEFSFVKHTVPATEDCLYLNVFTPAWEPPERGFPVMAYIHGGAFMIDGTSNCGEITICENLCQYGIVYVTLAYRVGYLGFLTVGDDSICPSNVGLWDKAAGLQWVVDNISQFGGNANNITLMGPSAGGASSDMLHLSPHTNKLFHKTILFAGSSHAPWCKHEGKGTETMEESCTRFARERGIEWTTKQELVQRLRELPAEQFKVEAWSTQGEDMDADFDCTPVEGGEFFCNQTYEELRKKAPPIPMMTGVTNLEGLIFTFKRRPDEAAAWKFLDHCIPEGTENRDEAKRAFFQKYIDHIKGDKEEASEKDIYRARLEVFGDYYTAAPALQVCLEYLGNFGDAVPVYLYVFAYYNPDCYGPLKNSMPVQDATHGLELAYFLGKGCLFQYDFNEDDKKMLKMFCGSCANFAKYGDPNGPAEKTTLPIKWEPVSVQQPERHIVFTLNPKMSDSYLYGLPMEIIKNHEKTRSAEL